MADQGNNGGQTQPSLAAEGAGFGDISRAACQAILQPDSSPGSARPALIPGPYLAHQGAVMPRPFEARVPEKKSEL